MNLPCIFGKTPDTVHVLLLEHFQALAEQTFHSWGLLYLLLDPKDKTPFTMNDCVLAVVVVVVASVDPNWSQVDEQPGGLARADCGATDSAKRTFHCLATGSIGAILAASW